MSGLDHRRLEHIRDRLMRALRHERPRDLRRAVVELASDIELMLDGQTPPDELCAETLRSRAAEQTPTLRCPPPDFWEIDVSGQAPPTPVTMAPGPNSEIDRGGL